jgi:hypothetical protein
MWTTYALCDAYQTRPKFGVRTVNDGAGDGSRTRDLLLGKQTLYQLSYSRTRPRV